MLHSLKLVIMYTICSKPLLNLYALNSTSYMSTPFNLFSSSTDDPSSVNQSQRENVTYTPQLWKPIYLYRLNISMTTRDLVLGITDFACGAEGLCNNSLSRGGGLCTVECKPCHCDELCHFYGDCCPDLLFQGTDNLVSQQHPYLICVEDYWTTWLNLSNIFMVGKCPPNADPLTEEKCDRPDVSIQRQATPVSDLKSNVTYRNVFCAQCHDVKDYESWAHEVTCSIGSPIQFATSKADLWQIAVEAHTCDIVTRPPSFGTIRSCYPVQYSSCNATGIANEMPEPIVETLCHMYSQPVHYYGSDPFFDSYRNLFCAYCDGALLSTFGACSRNRSPSIPFPLNFLLDFNGDNEIDEQPVGCESGQVFDPLTMSCRSITCSLRRVLVGNKCEEIFSVASGLGIAINAVLQPIQTTTKISSEDFLDKYLSLLHTVMAAFQPYIISEAEDFYYSSDPTNDLLAGIEIVNVRANIVSLSGRTLPELESALLDAMTSNFTLTLKNDSMTLTSTPYLCSRPYEAQHPYRRIFVSSSFYLSNLSNLDPVCGKHDCASLLTLEPVQINCPFLQYNLTRVNFTFDTKTNSLSVGDKIAYLKPFTFLLCKDLLKICVDTLKEIEVILTQNPEGSFALSITSLVCNCLSLIGLALTFMVYVILSELRTLPGMNTMALVFNLFLAQLLFLTTSNRTSNTILCQIFGVLTHYFWLSSFAWMSVSAFHMCKVFTRLRARESSSLVMDRFIRYCLISNLCPMIVVGGCLAIYLIRSDGIDSGYGEKVCFVNNNVAVGVFFAGPLCLMLLMNAFFFTKTALAIRSVPDMKSSTNRSNKGHISVYIKLSLLFGFTWTFGILAEIIRSDVLRYAFVILTGSQGLLLFVAYCVNQRTWEMLKQVLFSSRYKPDSTNVPSQTSISK